MYIYITLGGDLNTQKYLYTNTQPKHKNLWSVCLFLNIFFILFLSIVSYNVLCVMAPYTRQLEF